MALQLENLSPEEEFNRKVQSILKGEDSVEETPDTVEEDSAVETEEAVEPEPEEESEDAQIADVEEEVPDSEPDDGGLEEDDEELFSKKTLTKEQAAIVRLKKEHKELKKQLEAQQEKQAANLIQKKTEDGAKKYLDLGYDEETSKHFAENDLLIARTTKKLATLEFKADNAELLKKYPSANTDMDKIMNVMEATGFTAEQVCRAMYPIAEVNPVKARATAAVTGKLSGNETSGNAVSRAMLSEKEVKTSALTAADRTKKKQFEANFGFGTISDERFLELKEQYHL